MIAWKVNSQQMGSQVTISSYSFSHIFFLNFEIINLPPCIAIGPVGPTPNLYRMGQPNVNGNSATVNGTQSYGAQSMNHSVPSSSAVPPNGVPFHQNQNYHTTMQQSQPGVLGGALPPPQRQQQQPYSAGLPGQMNGPPQPIPPTNNTAPWTTPYSSAYQPVQAQLPQGGQYPQQV